MGARLPHISDRAFLTMLLGLSLAGNVGLYYNLHSTAQNQPAAPARSRVVGTRLPDLTGLALDGTPISLTFRGRPTVLYLLNPTCPYCSMNGRAIGTLSTAQKQYRFVAVATSTQSLEVFLSQHPARFDTIIKNVAKDYLQEHDLVATPATVVISAEGIIVRHWTGVYRGAVREEIQKYFGVSLSGE
jgi:peroxiredoxin